MGEKAPAQSRQPTQKEKQDNAAAEQQHRIETGSDVAVREESFNKVLRNGAGAGVGAFTAAGLATVYLSRRWPPMQHISVPFRTFGVLAVGMMAGVIAAENTSVVESRRQYDEMVAEDARFSRPDTRHAKMPFRDRALEWAKDHRWSGVAYGWGASMAVSMYYVNRQPLDFKQKIVQARIYAQVVTIVLLFVAGGLASVHPSGEDAEQNEEDKALMRERAMYKFKKGSDADKRLKGFEREMHHPENMPDLPEGDA